MRVKQKSNRTNREALNAMSNEQLAKLMNHIDCSMCAYYNDPDTEPDHVCAKQHERMNDPEAGSRICIEGLAKWLGQEEAWWMKGALLVGMAEQEIEARTRRKQNER